MGFRVMWARDRGSELCMNKSTKEIIKLKAYLVAN